MSLRQAALELSFAGLAVFPLAPMGKRPINENGCHGATLDEDLIDAWWTRTPNANVGLATGPSSGLLVLDVDPDHGGNESLLALPIRPMTWIVETHSGGYHLYYRYPAGRFVGNSAGKLGPGLDVRGMGGYVVAPPSIGHTGRSYQWLFRDELRDAPVWMVDILERKVQHLQAVEPPSVHPGDPTPYGIAALMAETAHVALCIEGTRNAQLNRAAFRIGQLEGGGELPLFYSWKPLTEAGVRAGLPRDEAAKVAERGLEAGHAHPRRRTTAA